MRILYADTGLRGLEGHIASSSLALPPAFRRLGHEVTVLGHRDLVPSLQQAAGAVPLFRYYTWGTWSSDPLIGWLTDFTEIVDATRADLHRGWVEHGPFDFVYFNTARAAQLAAIGLWFKEAFPDQGAAPIVAIQLGPDPGLARSGSPGAPVFTLREPTTALHRYAAYLLGKEWTQKLNLLAVNETVAEEYSFIVDLPVKAMTTPEELPATRLRKSDGGLTVGFLGYQRVDKGYDLLPDLIEQLAQTHPGLRFLVQHSDPLALAQEFPQRNLEITARLRELADRNRCIELILRPAVGSAWFELIDRCDMVALPYDPVRYASGYSAIFGEALASGAPIVAPGGTTMSTEIEKAGGFGVSFSQWTVPSIASAIGRAVDSFDDLASRAYRGGVAWHKQHGPDAYVAQVLEAVGLAGVARLALRRERRIRHRLPTTFFGNPQLQNGSSLKADDNAIGYISGWPQGLSSFRSGRSFLRRKLLQQPVEIASAPVEVVNKVIETTTTQWHYSLTFDVDAGIVDRVPAGSRLMAEVILEVERGAVGVSWIDRGSQIASAEKTILARSGVQCAIVSGDRDKVHRLMLRNVSPNCEKAVFVVKGLSATADATLATEPPVPAGSGSRGRSVAR